jgi:hypothetical protein
MLGRPFVAALLGGLGVLLGCQHAVAAESANASKHLERIKAVGSEGQGNKDAAIAWKELVGLGIDALLPTLSAMDDAKTVPQNWLQLAGQAIAERELRAKRPLPAKELEAFVKDTKHAPSGRRAAYEILVMADAKAPERLLPTMIDDQSIEIRRDAIASAIVKATPLIKSDAAKAAKEFEKLFHASRDLDQTEKIAKVLKELKVETDMNKHFGVVSDWMLIGPFDSTNGTGFPKSFAPETKVDIAAACKGKTAEVKWQPHKSAEPFGMVDLNKAIGKHKDACAYAFTVVESEKETPAEIRLGCIAAVKVFVNGKEVFAREEYHHGQRFDQYIAAGTLKAGRNEILVKVCQNNQTDSWAQEWRFQLRLCDSVGGALPVKIIKNG